MVFKVKRGSLLGFEVRENNLYYDNNNSEDKNDILFCLFSQKNVKREITWAGKRRPKPTSREEKSYLGLRAANCIPSINMS
jgi:hypothetical protein